MCRAPGLLPTSLVQRPFSLQFIDSFMNRQIYSPMEMSLFLHFDHFFNAGFLQYEVVLILPLHKHMTHKSHLAYSRLKITLMCKNNPFSHKKGSRLPSQGGRRFTKMCPDICVVSCAGKNVTGGKKVKRTGRVERAED